ncbi:unnamed protein product, partial [Heterosigma akashiwo]
VTPILVIGSGPHALAFVTKFLEPSSDPFEETPWNSTLFTSNTSESHYKYRFSRQYLRGERGRVIRQKVRNAERQEFAPEQYFRIVDTNGEWLRQWQSQFDRLGIQYLRSGDNAHVDPVSWETMRMGIYEKHCAWIQDEPPAYREPRYVPRIYGRHCKCTTTKKHDSEDQSNDDNELPACRELQFVPRNDSYHGPFSAPSSRHFVQFCDKIVERYNLQSMVEEASAQSISVEEEQNVNMSNEKRTIYKVTLSTGRTIRALHIVLALGPQRVRKCPAPLVGYLAEDQEVHSTSRSRLPIVHSLDLLRPNSQDEWIKLLHCLEKKNVPAARVLVIGGGLTSSHLVLRLHQHFSCGTTEKKKVQLTLISRGQLQVQPFDLKMSWMGRTRRHKLALFWSEQDYERRAMLVKDAKNRASITPEVFHQLQQLQNQQVLVLRENMELTNAEYLEQEHQWQVHNNSLYDYIICATGTSTSLTNEPLLSSFCSQMEFTSSTNQAKLTPDLRIADGQNVYVLGDAAALQLGPDAGNLMGARAGAARVARAIRKSLGK